MVNSEKSPFLILGTLANAMKASNASLRIVHLAAAWDLCYQLEFKLYYLPNSHKNHLASCQARQLHRRARTRPLQLLFLRNVSVRCDNMNLGQSLQLHQTAEPEILNTSRVQPFQVEYLETPPQVP